MLAWSPARAASRIPRWGAAQLKDRPSTHDGIRWLARDICTAHMHSETFAEIQRRRESRRPMQRGWPLDEDFWSRPSPALSVIVGFPSGVQRSRGESYNCEWWEFRQPVSENLPDNFPPPTPGGATSNRVDYGVQLAGNGGVSSRGSATRWMKGG
ncbi:hypothetical protein BDP81DRAFT_141337 [Colletotrichum phormii]|uniref:Uncharacterized protein n=1 Tax=Colletotrichum phormii TaxID=359342 RepID=A0AAJ0E8K2_9PEZI|nr:uncharacterized protein BDP81DRAFT_141337 [Colletotrichum phormii]KAK1622949.1 hypothetical protein BDP81DRAFT_141337 [Colletotrichum phormii]